jgi:hypothetical protein
MRLTKSHRDGDSSGVEGAHDVEGAAGNAESNAVLMMSGADRGDIKTSVRPFPKAKVHAIPGSASSELHRLLRADRRPPDPLTCAPGGLPLVPGDIACAASEMTGNCPGIQSDEHHVHMVRIIRARIVPMAVGRQCTEDRPARRVRHGRSLCAFTRARNLDVAQPRVQTYRYPWQLFFKKASHACAESKSSDDALFCWNATVRQLSAARSCHRPADGLATANLVRLKSVATVNSITTLAPDT